MISSNKKDQVPLIVDLDRTFIKQDTFISDCWSLFKSDQLGFFYQILQVVLGKKAKVKHKLGKKSEKGYKGEYQLNEEFFNFIYKQKQKQEIYLLTGASIFHANNVAKLHPIFLKVKASSSKKVLGVSEKLLWLKKKKIHKYDYAGDRLGDYKIFKNARISYIVNPTIFLLIKLKLKPLSNNYFFDIPKIFSQILKTIKIA